MLLSLTFDKLDVEIVLLDRIVERGMKCMLCDSYPDNLHDFKVNSSHFLYFRVIGQVDASAFQILIGFLSSKLKRGVAAFYH